MKALVTGASSGIGREIALRLSRDGCELFLVARRAALLEQLTQELPGPAHVLPMDLGERSACHALYNQLREEEIDILVNNAGFGVYGPYMQTSLERELQMLDLNIESMHILMKLFLTDFVRRDSGYILNTSSAASFLPGPLLSSYYASKAYVTRLTQAVREELRREGSRVYVGALCPGPVATEFDKVAGTKKSLTGMAGLSAHMVANYAVDKMYAGKTIIVPGAAMKVSRFFSKILPDSFLARSAYEMQKKKG